MTSRLFPIAFAVVALTAACNSDSAMGPARHNDIIGTWISTGSDVAVGLTTSMKAAAVKATFSANNTYRIEVVDSTLTTITYSGTWSASSGEGIRTITLNQQTPTVGTEQGAFLVDGARLTYEVVPMSAARGSAAGGPAASFGSSNDGTTSSSIWIQRFWDESVNLTSQACNPDSSTVLSRRPCDRVDWLNDGKSR